MRPRRAIFEQNDPVVFECLKGEERRQQYGLELIPCENYTYSEVQTALGSAFTNQLSENYPGREYHCGKDFGCAVEKLAIERACEVFRADHANVRPQACSPMNPAVFLALLEPGDTIMAMGLAHGKGLTRGAPKTHRSTLFNFVRYTYDPQTGEVDFDELRRLAKKHQPKLLLCGHTAYPRDLDYAAFKAVADEVGALTMADISAIAGLIAGGTMENPMDYGFDVMTMTTAKTLRGPRSGMIFCRDEHSETIDEAVRSGLKGGTQMNAIAGTAIAMAKAQTPEFKAYAIKAQTNATVLAEALKERGVRLITNGTDNHIVLIDTQSSFKMDGRTAEDLLDEVGINVSRQLIPGDTNPARLTSGIRIGTLAATTRGMQPADMENLAEWICNTLGSPGDLYRRHDVTSSVESLCRKHPVPGIE